MNNCKQIKEHIDITALVTLAVDDSKLALCRFRRCLLQHLKATHTDEVRWYLSSPLNIPIKVKHREQLFTRNFCKHMGTTVQLRQKQKVFTVLLCCTV